MVVPVTVTRAGDVVGDGDRKMRWLKPGSDSQSETGGAVVSQRGAGQIQHPSPSLTAHILRPTHTGLPFVFQM